MKKLIFVSVGVIIIVLAACILGYNTALASEKSIIGKLAEPDIKSSQLEMPIISVNTNGESEIKSDKTYSEAQISILDAKGNYEMIRADMSIRLRGNSSMYADKPSYKIKFEEKQNLLNIGNGEGKTWCLIANYYDGSLLRNFTAYHMADFLSAMTYSPKCCSAELYVNGEYQGVYLLCEEVNISKSRVDITDKPDEVQDNGYLVEMTRYSDENMFRVDTATYVVDNDLSENKSIKKKQLDYISNYITKAYNLLLKGNQKDIEKYINIDSLVDIYIGNEIIKNVDAGWDSFYMHKDDNGKLYFGPMWDYDLSMGNANCTKGIDEWKGFNPYHILNLNANSNPWFSHALSYKWFRELVKARWNELQKEIDKLPDIVIEEAQSNYNAYCRNYEKWDNVLGKQVYIEPSQISGLSEYKEHYTYLSNWLDKRIEWLTDYYNCEAFMNGIFVNQEGRVLSAESNLLEICPVLVLQNEQEVDLTYELSNNIGMTMNIKNAGKEVWSTQFDASSFMLEKGAEYILSFDYKCSRKTALVFNIQQNYEPWSAYYSDIVEADNELRHYEAAVTAPESDSNCALVFSLGGSDFSNIIVTLDNMSLIKKADAPAPAQDDKIEKSSQNPKITRAEFISLLAYLAGADLKSDTASKFTDVKDLDEYSGPVQWAYSKGIIAGAGGEFRPDTYITYQEMLVMLYNYARNEGADVSDIEGNAINELTEVEEISAWARTPVRWAINNGILDENAVYTFSPKADVTRLDAAEFTSKLISEID
ncbi:S-layer family protein [Ruminiclostridium sufflavum DSM 19573]|uniref:S-layer family protein n=1 Tax=Ruminiclostridium sufflavum DSM 19573 TaxID=1121337 RepID=A0A318XK00_9FIRM|nr:CotH kinase family protein [Ruminiclostridium sufflavum]PYG87339.1 S-layer family protein [Ruminiclostridium sufflavum DSM 19573]